MANAITRMITLFSGSFVGEDQFGNKYYHQKKAKAGSRRRRWVIYKESDEGSRVPPEHNAWLHYTINDFPTGGTAKSWQKPHEPNHTGTELAYRPPGHILEGGQRSKATGDYEAWQPE
ncbi:NADH:ubiquinone oxidoreductase subunit NDUFA12 [Aestuariispira insulae]|uniref:NADH:ubiquinone oxidoreductase subunit n=1 Tax=Aestuariispira insulae TaxID=1461337 RepID=A0A3D9HKC6_9PROT|nr:NADH:ubiquinone oxidoreductase subunit NDUFA12 [Aestuariispira insulae]RED49949.1 NADH:ubiquinone oxidoreductase subunit [Aestuariispira insulae]